MEGSVKKLILLGVVAVLTLAACGGDDDEPSAEESANDTTQQESTTTVASSGSSAIALATQAGCTNPELSAPSETPEFGLPEPTEQVTCTVDDQSLSINVYASHEDVQQVTSAQGQAVICSVSQVLDIESVHLVAGDDFTATITPEGETQTREADAQALADTLGSSVQTIEC
jgi:ABC-type phosphate transport system substrate-binding protein